MRATLLITEMLPGSRFNGFPPLEIRPRSVRRRRPPPPAPVSAAAADNPRDPFAIPEWEAGYPEPSIFGLLPAYGLFVRHAVNVTIRDVEVGFAKEDGRAAIALMDVAGIEFDHVKAQHATGAPFFALRKVDDFSVHQVPGLPDTRRARIEQEDL